MDFFQKAKEYHEYMKNIREQIHMYPELGGEEIKTGNCWIDTRQKKGRQNNSA